MPSRTKSCALCRKKRMRCDATVPECLMCVRFGRQCPGLTDGPLIVDMTKTARYGMQKRKARIPSTGIRAAAAARSIPNHTSVHRISQRGMMTEAFYERFLTYFTSKGEGKDIQNRLTWLHRLPLLSTDGTNDALVLALEATASAYCATDNISPALTRYAWDLYGKALQAHSRFVAQSRSREEVTIHMVSTSVLFSFFEAMQDTSANAYRSHIYGAAKMLEVTGPGQCTQGVLCQIFYHLRTQLAFVNLTGWGNERPVEVRRILHETLEYTRLPMFQRLMTHVTKLAEMLVMCENVDESGTILQSVDLASYLLVKTEVESLWNEYSSAAASSSEELSWCDSLSGTTQYRDSFTALTVAYFESARILLANIPLQFTTSFLDPDDHYTVIMEASQYLQTYDIGFAYMRMATPLLLVALYAPREKQREEAIRCFESWESRSLRGISALALGKINQRKAMNYSQEKKRISQSDLMAIMKT
ncbi:hypothetical protein BKA66DRAFT_470672 [Pyrenochaeta sp. MPI-SDFR-AT-0127]|nr:hypothetical protein BKA66DRAFT_470672 [Pyrenochaeta sp. MPI-SDFR-AT-0127]